MPQIGVTTLTVSRDYRSRELVGEVRLTHLGADFDGGKILGPELLRSGLIHFWMQPWMPRIMARF